MKKKKLPFPKEKEVIKAVLEWLGWHHIFAWRQNSGRFFFKVGSKTRMFNTGIKGQADITGILEDGKRLEIECKRRGEGPTPDQKAFLNKMKENGGVAFVAYEIEDLEKQLKDYI